MRAAHRKGERSQVEQQRLLELMVERHPLVIRAILDGWQITAITGGPRTVQVGFKKMPRTQDDPWHTTLEFSTTDGSLQNRQEALRMGLDEEPDFEPGEGIWGDAV